MIPNARLLQAYEDIQKRKTEAAPVRHSESLTAVARSGQKWVEKLVVAERGVQIDGLGLIAQHQFETIMFNLRPFLDRQQMTVEDVCEAGLGAGLTTGLLLGFALAEQEREDA